MSAPAYPAVSANTIVLWGRWYDHLTRAGRDATITAVPRAAANQAVAGTPNLIDHVDEAEIKTAAWTTRPLSSALWALPLLSNNDAQLGAFGGWEITAGDEPSILVELLENTPTVEATEEMVDALSAACIETGAAPHEVQPGDLIQAVWVRSAALLNGPAPVAPTGFLNSAQVVDLIAGVRQLPPGGSPGQTVTPKASGGYEWFLGGGARSATVIVAADNSPNKTNADYVCTGAADQLIINEALAGAAMQGGAVLLRAGEYRINSPIIVPDHTSLVGESKPGWKAYVGSYPIHNQESDLGTKIKVVAPGIDYAITWAATNFGTPGDPRVRAMRISYLYVYGYQGTGVGIGCPMNAYPADFIEISDNFVHNTAIGIQGNLDAPIIRGNNVQDVTSHGMLISAMYPAIDENIVFDIGGAGLRLVGGARGQVFGNTFGDIGAEGVLLASRGVACTGNSIAAPTTHGFIIDAPDCALVGNTIGMENPVGGHDLNDPTSCAVFATANVDGATISANTMRRDKPGAGGYAVNLADGSTRCAVGFNSIVGAGWASGASTTVRWRTGARHQVGLNVGDSATGVLPGPVPVTTGAVAWWFNAETVPAGGNGAVVTRWPDSSGNNRDLTLHGGCTYKASGAGGRPAVSLNGLDAFGTYPTAATGQPLTVFIVAKKTATGNGIRSLLNAYDGDTVALYIDNGGVFNVYAGGFFGGPAATSSPAVFEAVVAGVDSELRLDGGSTATGDPGASALSTGLTVGSGKNGGGEFFDGDIYEVVVYNGALSSGDRSAVRAALGAKYGITVA